MLSQWCASKFLLASNLVIIQSYFIRVGAGDLDHVRFAEKCDLFSNGLSIASCVTPQHDSLDGLYQELLCTSYCLDRNLDNMLSLWTDVLTRLLVE